MRIMYGVAGKGGPKAEVDSIIHLDIFLRASEHTTPPGWHFGKQAAVCDSVMKETPKAYNV